MPSYRNTFTKLMNQDTAVNKFNPENYYELRNGRVISAGGLDIGNIVSEDGNKLSFIFPFSIEGINMNNAVIIGMFPVRNHLIIFTTTGGGANPDQIWRVKYDPKTKQVWNAAETSLLDWGDQLENLHLLYFGDLAFSTSNRISLSYQYETSEINKIYWVDGNNELKHLNLALSVSDIRALTTDQLTILPNTAFSTPKPISVITGGQYKAGVVQYSYQLFNTNGAETPFAPISVLVHLTGYSDYLSDNLEYFGSPFDTEVSKSVIVNINDIDQSYDGIRVVSIYYTSLDSTPAITTFYENFITSTSITITDAGDTTLGTFTTQELNSIGSILLYPKTIETKDNILFLGNIQEKEYFDVDLLYSDLGLGDFWDSRAYRWNSSQLVFKIDGSTHDTVVGIEETANCVLELADQYDYRFNENGNLGGSGININYEFQLSKILIDNRATNSGTLHVLQWSQPWSNPSWLNSSYVDNNSYGSFASPINAGYIKGQMRDEVYAYAMVLRDKRGRRSYPKWIADIKMPAMGEFDVKTTYDIDGVPKSDYALLYTNSNGDSYGLSLGVKFTVDLSMFGDEVSGWEIVRMKRTDSDKTILDQGFVLGTSHDTEDNIEHPHSGINGHNVGSSTLNNSSILEFSSPNYLFNNEHSHITSTDYLQTECGYSLNSVNVLDNQINTRTNKLTAPILIANDAKQTLSITNGKIVKSILTENTQLGSKTYRNEIQFTGGSPEAKRDANLVFYTADSWTPDSIYGLTGLVLVCNYKRNLTNQYGGNTYNSRTNRNYISTNSYVDTSFSSNYIYSGDTYISYYDYHRLSAKDNPANTEIVIFPVETTVNIDLRTDKTYTRFAITDTDRDALQEFAYAYSYDIGTLYTGDYTQEYDLNVYNKVYSQESTVVNYPAKQLLATDIVTYDSRFRYSEQKTFGELSDSWLTFLIDNKKDVQSNYGAITSLVNFRNRLFFHQENAFGVLSVNERALTINTSTGAELVLGTGGVLDAFGYISIHSGTRHPFSVKSSPQGLYYFDSASQELMAYTGESLTPLSTLKGLSSWIRNNITEDVLTQDDTCNLIGVHSVYDRRNNRMLFTFLDTTNKDTFSYSEFGGGFESFYDFQPHIYADMNGILLSVDPSNKNIPYVHGEGVKGNFYGNISDTVITILSNPEPEINKLFSNCEFGLNCTSNGSDVEQTFHTYRAWNQYQDTGYKAFTIGGNIKRKSKIRLWRFMFGRDSVDDRSRLRDKHMFVKFWFGNANNYDMNLQDIIIYYQSSIR